MLSQKGAKRWDAFDIEELRGKTMGIVGYGDIGRATAKLASVYGMRVVGASPSLEYIIIRQFC